MGGHTYNRDDSPRLLLHHPNFKLPEVPQFLATKQDEKVVAIVDYVLECVATFLSPKPQLPDEDQIFDCKGLAKTVRKDLAAPIIEKLMEAKRNK